jgi:hypothetical protein
MSPSGLVFKVQKALAGLRYPADKQELLEHARLRGADDAVIQGLLLLPDRLYQSPVALSVELSRELARWRRMQ